MSKTTCTKAMSSIIQYANKDYPKLYYIHIKLDPNTTSMLYIDNTRYKNTMKFKIAHLNLIGSHVHLADLD